MINPEDQKLIDEVIESRPNKEIESLMELIIEERNRLIKLGWTQKDFVEAIKNHLAEGN